MARYSNVSTNFSGGLISDHLVGRIDIDRAANSARKFTNFFPTVQGPAEYRPGFEYGSEETDSQMTNTVSSSIVVNEDIAYRIIFGPATVKIFDTDGVLIDTLTSPYSQSELKDLRFSSETDKLYITHPNHRPRILTASLGFTSSPLLALAETPGDPNITLTTTGGLLLATTVEITGLGDWTLNEITTKIEPFLEPDTSDNVLRIDKGEEVVKIVSSDAGLQTIIDAGSGSWTNYYIEYDLKGTTVLGKVIDESDNYAEVGDPSVSNGVYTIYVDAVDFVTEVTAADAKLFLLDNAETTNGSIQEKQLEQDGVPDGEVHLRSDVDIFSNANTGSWIRLGEENRSDKVLFGADAKFDLTRWVKISEYIGLETHPIEFYRGDKYIEETSQTHDYTVYDNGSVYKAFGDSEFTIEDIAGNTAGEVRADGNRVFVWNGGAFRGDTLFVYNEGLDESNHNLKFTVPNGHGVKAGDTVNISGLTFTSGDTDLNGDQTVDEAGTTFIQFNFTSNELNHDVTGDATLTVKSHDLGTNSIVGDLTTGKSLEVLKCDSSLTVQEHNSSSNPTGLLVKTTVAATVVTEIANDVTITATQNIFDITTSPNRHIKGVMPSGMVYMKILEYTNQKVVRARLNNTVPRNEVTGGYENNGVFTEFSLGAWYPNNFPKAVAKYEQRRVYAGTYTNPNFVFFSKLNDEEDFAPTQDDKQVLDTDGISYGISNVNAAVTWLSAGTDLVVGTSNGIFKLVTNQFNAAVSPKTVRIELVDEVGCDKDGVLAGTSIFFPDESSTELLEYKFDSDVQAGATDDVAKFVYPTFVRDTIKKVVFQNNPQPRLWLVTDAGVLYVLTYHRQENFYAWSKQETNGTVIDATVLRKAYDSGIDQVWITVKRGSKYFYERLFSEVDSSTEPTLYLDNATSFNNFNISQNWDETYLYIPASERTVGDIVSVVVDDVYLGEHAVETVTGTFAGTKVKVPYQRSSGVVTAAFGTKYTGTLQMMYPTWNGQNKPAFGSEEARIISQKVFTIDSVKFKHGINSQYDTIKLPGNTFPINPELGTLTKFTGFDRERPVRNSQFGVEKIPELVQDEPYKTVFGSLVTKTDLN